MANIKLAFCFVLISYIFFITPVLPVQAQITKEAWDKITLDADEMALAAGFDVSQTGGDSVGQLAETIITAFLGLLGIIFIILILIAGYNWMTAGGDEQKVNKSKDTIRHAIIGLIIILAAYLITYFVFTVIPFGAGGGGANSPGNTTIHTGG